ncbi:MAG: PD-(D/E)XK nuclease family protein [Desulfobulbaceae bacterium]
MSDQLLLTLQTALQQLAMQHTVETLGDRATYLGVSEIGACPRKTILSKLNPPEADLVTLLRFRRGHMAEDIVATAFTAAGFTNFQRQVEVRSPGDVPVTAHIDFVFTSMARKTMAVLEVKSPETLPVHPYGSWETQLYLQMGLLAAANPDYTVEKGAILAVNFGASGMALFNGYTPQPTLFEGLMGRAGNIWNDYQRVMTDTTAVPAMEISSLCGYCPFVTDCPKFEVEEVRELTESVEILTELQKQQKDLEAEIDLRRKDLLAIVSARGPLKAHGRLLQKATRSKKTLNIGRLADFLKGYGQSLADFEQTSTYSFLEIKKAA